MQRLWLLMVFHERSVAESIIRIQRGKVYKVGRNGLHILRRMLGGGSKQCATLIDTLLDIFMCRKLIVEWPQCRTSNVKYGCFLSFGFQEPESV
jgi:hypothetical protein